METYVTLTLRWSVTGPHYRLTLFTGEPGKTAVNIGTLIMSPREAVRMRNTLRSGSGIDGVGVFNGVLEKGWIGPEPDCSL